MITKISYRDQVRKLLLKKMKSGQLKPGSSLSLASISRDLDVSVTPVREALTQLEHSKLIKSVPNRGFIIPLLTASEAKNLYELIGSLEALAIENSTFSSKTIEELETQQRKFKEAKSAIDRVNTDLKFHSILTSGYKNNTAQQLLSDIKTRIFFYEIEFMKHVKFHNDSEDHHDQIIENIKNNDIKYAVNLLKDNWIQILKFQYITA